MTAHVMIPDSEYQARIKKAAQLISAANLDVMIANSNEADFANVRYFSGYWPLFEIGGVAIAPDAQAALMIGPESETYAADRSKIPNIHRLLEYRESADPDFPGAQLSNFVKVCESIGVRQPKRIGLAGYLVTSIAVYDSLKAAFPNAEIVNADDIMTSMRQIKSEAELACLREGFRISELALARVIDALKPGLTELQVVGIAQQALYEFGAEYEAHALYVFAGKSTNHAISRPTHRVMKKGDLIQLDIGGRIDGYSPSVGRPLCLGKMSPRQRELVEFGREAHYQTCQWLKAGTLASQVAQKYIDLFNQRGYGDTYLYGPCHGLGMLEVEKPWMETSSNYPLQPNMTYQVDTFVQDQNFGLRWENGARITNDEPELMSEKQMDIIEIE